MSFRRLLPTTRLCLVAFIVLLCVAETAPISAQACVGDCNSDGTVAINELIAGVNLALGTAPLSQCPSFDADGNGSVGINELIAAVNAALNGCRLTPPQGVLLQGDPGGLAIDATTDMPPVGVDAGEIQDGVILTRLDLNLAPGATVGQVNAALQSVNGGVVSMSHGLPILSIAIPRPADLDALVTVVQTLRAAPGISWTDVAHAVDPKVLPPSPAGDNLDQLSHLLPARFPAAWNASHLATADCTANKISVLVADVFQPIDTLAGRFTQFKSEIPNPPTVVGEPSPQDETHAYDVTTTLAGLFDAANPTGANPFSQCLQIELIQLTGLTEWQRQQRIASQFPSGKFLLNYSEGYPDERWDQAAFDYCKMIALLRPPGCTAADVGMFIDLPLSRAYHGAEWIGLTANRWNDFLVAVAAGNENDDPGTAVYPGLGVAAFDAGMCVATVLPDDAFLSDASTWNAQGGLPGIPNLTASDGDIAAFRQYLLLLSNAGAAGPANNVLIVGSTKPGQTPDALEESDFSDSFDAQGSHGPDVFAVGEGVFTLEPDDDGLVQGTSFSAPQVAGLASYLWLLSPELRNAPAAMTRKAIVGNSRGIGVIDAYASALSLDAADLPTPTNAPVRLAILDADGDGKFDEADLGTFLDKIVSGDNPERDYSRYDINGDGFTGGPTTERFDLDRVGSTRFGASRYSTVTQSIEGETASFDELHLTDLQILCYYAYSPLYTGATDRRRDLLAHACGTDRFGAERELVTSIEVEDPIAGVDLVRQAKKANDEGGQFEGDPLPFLLNVTDTFNPGGGSAPVMFHVEANADGPIAVSPDGSGTFTVSALCSASAGASDPAPKMPDLRVTAGGSLFVSVPTGSVTLQVNGQISKTGSRSTTGTNGLQGSVEFNWQDTGGQPQNSQTELNDGETSDSVVPVMQSITVSAPGDVSVHWSVNADCAGQGNATTSGGIDVLRSGELTLSYSLSR